MLCRAGMRAGAERGPGHRRDRRERRPQPVVAAHRRKLREVRELALGDEAVGQLRILAVEADDDEPLDERFDRPPAAEARIASAERPDQQRDEGQNDGREDDEKRREQGKARTGADIGVRGPRCQEDRHRDEPGTPEAMLSISKRGDQAVPLWYSKGGVWAERSPDDVESISMAWWQQTYRRFRYGRPVVVVSGLPRSGTSMMMKMLEAGGIPVWLDGVRTADNQNPKGYYELERVKELDKGLDKSWVREGRGRAVKVISSLLEHLPTDEQLSGALHEPQHPGGAGFTKQDALATRGGGRVGERCRAPEVLRDAPAQGEYFLAHEPGFSALDVKYARRSRGPRDDGATHPHLSRRQPQRRGHDRGRGRPAVSQPAAGVGGQI